MNADTPKFSPTHLLEGWWVTVQGYLQNNLNNLKTKKEDLGALPQTPLTCEAAGAGGKTNPPTPTASVGSIPRHQG